MPINYQPTTWVNNQDPPISADNLNHIEQGIKTTADRVDELVTVEANPSSSATDRLTGLEVDGTVYEVGGGHKVYTDDGTLLPQEPGLQFASGCVEDDAVNGKTVYIEMIRISQANYDTLKANGQLKPGAKYFIYDAQPVAVNAYNLPYSASQNTGQKIDSIELKKKTYSVTPQPNQYASPFTHAATINYDNDVVDVGHFVCGNAVIGAAVVVSAAQTYMLVYCNNSNTFNVDIYYK